MSSERTPLVSIAMCTFNGERFIREQLDSLIAQDYQNIEIIIFDDCSTDATYSILSDYASSHQQIKLLLNSSKLGFKRNFEKAFSHCSGKYIAPCDQDDIWHPNKISTLLKEINSDMVIFSNPSMINAEGESINTDYYNHIRINPDNKLRWQSLVFGNYILGHTMLFHSKILEHVLPIPHEFKEHDYWIAMYAASRNSIVYFPHALSHYRVHDKNCSISIKSKKNRNIGALIRYFLKKRRQTRALLNKYNNQIRLMERVEKIEHITEDEKNELKIIKEAYRNSRYSICIRNSRLKKLLKKNSTYASSRIDQKRFIGSICRGFLTSIIR